jgi:tetratricopeptide (TPR) repeat protein
MRTIVVAAFLALAPPALAAGAPLEPPPPAGTSQDCRQLVGRPDADARSVNECGFALFKLGRLREAAGLFGRAAALDPTQAAYANNLGAAHLKLGEPEAAEAAFRAALRNDPASAKISYNIAVALFREGRLMAAFQAYRQAESAGAAYTKARFEREEVQNELRSYVRENADNPELQAVLRAAARR